MNQDLADLSRRGRLITLLLIAVGVVIGFILLTISLILGILKAMQ